MVYLSSSFAVRTHEQYPETAPGPFQDHDLPFQPSLVREEAEGRVAQAWSDGPRQVGSPGTAGWQGSVVPANCQSRFDAGYRKLGAGALG